MTRPNRNVRNNNPLNIEKGDDWEGLATLQTDSRFAVFREPEYGFRAAYIILLRYLEREDDTIEQIITKWAPSSDGNHIETYSDYVAQRVRKDVDDFIAPDDLPGIMLAMADFEGAKGAYDINQVNLGITLSHQAEFVIARLQRIDEQTSLFDRLGA